MKILVTGFEPYGGERVNPSRQAALRLAPRFGDPDIVARTLPVRKAAAARPPGMPSLAAGEIARGIAIVPRAATGDPA